MGYLDEDPATVVPPDQSIGSLYAAKAAPQPFMPPSDDSITGRVGYDLEKAANLASATNPMGLMIGQWVGSTIADRYLQGQETRNPTSFQRDEPTVLQPMNTPLVDVQAAPTLAQTASQYRMAPGMGVGGGVGSGPSQSPIGAAQQERLAAGTKERDAQARIGVAQADRNEETARLEEEDAVHAARVYQNQQEINDAVNKGNDEFFQTNAKMANDIATAKVDSNRLYKNMGTAGAIVMGIGATLSGMMAGLRGGGPNEFMQSVDRLVDRDVADQQAAIEGKRAGLQARQSMYGQLLQQTGDRHLAAMQLKNLQLESIKQQTAAKAKALGTPEVLANSDKLIAGIEQNQALLKQQMAEQNAARIATQAQAAQAARAAGEQKAWDRQMQVAKLGQDQQALDIKAAEAGVGTGAGTGPLAGVPKDLRNEAAKELSTHAAAEKGVQGIGDQFKKWDETSILSPKQLAATRASIANQYKASLGPGLSSDKDFDTYIAPNLPQVGDTRETLAMKQANMVAAIRGKVATPILDQTQPGWRMPATVKVKK